MRHETALELPGRRARLSALLDEHGVDALFLPPSSDLEYLTGLERDPPSFGEVRYAHDWVTGAFLAPGREPLFVLPRMVLAFHLGGVEPGETVVVDETDDGAARFAAAVGSLARVERLGVHPRLGARTVLALQSVLPHAELVDAEPLVNRLRRRKSHRELTLMTEAVRIAEAVMADVAGYVHEGTTMAELATEVDHRLRTHGAACPSFPTHVFSWGPGRHDSGDATAHEPIRAGEVVMFDFGAVHAGYCSDFGRTVACGEPPPGFAEALALLRTAQEAGRAALVPGALARDVNAACRRPIEDAGLGDAFRHRMGHGIGLDVHERPFLSPEDETPLEEDMTFTDEPSLLIDERFGVRVEDVVVVAEDGGRLLGGG